MPSDSNRGIIKSTSIISLGTLFSRLLGFIRDIILAKLFGTGQSADAFFVAFRIPNMFRDVLGEGATNSTVVPVFAEYVVQKDKVRIWNFFSVILTLLLMVLSVVTILGIVFSPWIVRVIAPGFGAQTPKLLLTIQLTQLMFPYLVFIGLTAYFMGILFTLRSFASSAFGPCLLNIAMIVSALIASRTMAEPVFGLAIGVLVGGVLQLLVQVRSLSKNDIRFQKPKTLAHPGAQKVGRLLFPRLLGTAVYQLNVFVDTFCASLSSIVGLGGVSALYYATRIIQFPLGVVSVALASAILPVMAGFASQQNMDDFKRTLVFSLKNIFLVMVPTSVFLVLFSIPIIKILFERGEFGQYSTAITSSALLFSAIGLVSFAGARIMVTAFHSLQDTKTPVKVAGICLMVNLVLNFALMHPLKIGGIALASSISGTINFLALFSIMDKRIKGLSEQLGEYLLRIILISVVMGLAAVLIWPWLIVFDLTTRFVMIGILSFIIFAAMSLALRIEQVVTIFRWILNQK